jgi:chloramphenicol 3-O-phosphotransferase
MKLVFLYGLPATGKLTVARELAAITGYKLFHNHLTVDLLLSVFEFGSEAFVRLREEIWQSVMEQAAASGVPGLIFTFAPEKSVRVDWIAELIESMAARRATVLFVELTCALEVLKERMSMGSRAEFGKLTSVDLFEELAAAGIFDFAMPEPALSIDTNALTPKEAAQVIASILALQ